MEHSLQDTRIFYGDNSQEGKLIPVKAGVRYTVKPRLYVGVNAGVAFSINDEEHILCIHPWLNGI